MERTANTKEGKLYEVQEPTDTPIGFFAYGLLVLTAGIVITNMTEVPTLLPTRRTNGSNYTAPWAMS